MNLKVGDKLKFIKDVEAYISGISYKKNQIVTVTKLISDKSFEIDNLHWDKYGTWIYPDNEIFIKVNIFKQKIKFVKELL